MKVSLSTPLSLSLSCAGITNCGVLCGFAVQHRRPDYGKLEMRFFWSGKNWKSNEPKRKDIEKSFSVADGSYV
jgi:hypothetical protein